MTRGKAAEGRRTPGRFAHFAVTGKRFAFWTAAALRRFGEVIRRPRIGKISLFWSSADHGMAKQRYFGHPWPTEWQNIVVLVIADIYMPQSKLPTVVANIYMPYPTVLGGFCYFGLLGVDLAARALFPRSSI